MLSFTIHLISIFLLPSQDKLEELRKFDRSLDQFITQEAYYKRDYTEYFGDTLLNSPKIVKDELYGFWSGALASDSTLLPASSSVATFQNNHLVEFTSEDNFGSPYKIRYVVFNKDIKTDSLEVLKRDYIRVNAYLYSGSLLIKEITIGENDRSVSVFNYDKSGKITNKWRRQIFEGKILEIEEFRYIYSETHPSKDFYGYELYKGGKLVVRYEPSDQKSETTGYQYIYDKFGNWIIKSSTGLEFPDKKYRTITY